MSFQIIDYFKRQENVFNKIAAYLKFCSHKFKNKKLLCIFDIDETLLFTSKSGNQVTHHPLGKKIYHYCLNHNIEIALITAREGSVASLEYLMNQLNILKYENHIKVFMQSKKDECTSLYKYQKRKQLSKNYHIILNVGDQMSDLFKNDPQSFEICKSTYYFLKVKDDPSFASLKLVDLN